jgi:hypothetical protein
MATRKGPFGRIIRDVTAVCAPNGTVVATFAGPSQVINAAGYINGQQERARRYGWNDPELRAVTADGKTKKGDVLATSATPETPPAGKGAR